MLHDEPQDEGGLFCGKWDVYPLEWPMKPSCPSCDEVMEFGWDAAPGPYSPQIAECSCGAVLAIWDVEWCFFDEESRP